MSTTSNQLQLCTQIRINIERNTHKCRESTWNTGGREISVYGNKQIQNPWKQKKLKPLLQI